MLKKYILRSIYNYNLIELDTLSVAYVSFIVNTFKDMSKHLMGCCAGFFQSEGEKPVKTQQEFGFSLSGLVFILVQNCIRTQFWSASHHSCIWLQQEAMVILMKHSVFIPGFMTSCKQYERVLSLPMIVNCVCLGKTLTKSGQDLGKGRKQFLSQLECAGKANRSKRDQHTVGGLLQNAISDGSSYVSGWMDWSDRQIVPT